MIRKLIPLVIILALSAAAGFTAHRYVFEFQQKEIVDQAFARLNLFLGLRKTALEDHFKSSGSDVRAMSRNPIIMKAMLDLESAWIAQGLDAGDELRRQYITENPNPAGERLKFNAVPDGSDYSRAHARLQPWARNFLRHFGYYDLFLITADGNVIYSAQKEDDFGTNLTDGPYSGSGLGFVFASAKRNKARKPALSDFELYDPSGGTPAAFAGNAIVDGVGRVVGVLAVQLSPEPINKILDFNEGLGKSGETYVVGSDSLMRSQARFESSNTLLKKKVESESISKAHGGFSGMGTVLNYRGERALSAYGPLELQTDRWALIAERSEKEVMSAFDPRWSLAAGALAALVTALILFAFSSALLFRPASAREEMRKALKRAPPAAR